MNIAVYETFPILETALKRSLSPFSSAVHLERARRNVLYDLMIWDLSFLPRKRPFRTEILLIPGFLSAEKFSGTGKAFSVGMNRNDPVTLSSIGEDRAMLCLQREIFWKGISIGPFEKPVFFDRNYSLYKNIVLGFTVSLAEFVWKEQTPYDRRDFESGGGPLPFVSL